MHGDVRELRRVLYCGVRVREVALAAVFAACGGARANEVTVPTAPVPVAADAAAPVEAHAFDDRPFTAGPPIRFTIARGHAKTTRFPVSSSAGATVAPDGVTYVVDVIEPKRSGALLVSPSNPKGVLFSTKEVHDVRFSPSGKEVLILDDETRTVTVLSVPDGRELASARPVHVARFVDDDTVPLWDGCHLVVLSPRTGQKRTVSDERCGGADASDDGRVFVVGAPSRAGVTLERTPYRTLDRIDGVTGRITPIVHSSGDEPMQSIRLAPTGDKVCFYEGTRPACVTTGEGHPIPLPAGADVFGMVFSLEGTRVVYPGGKDLTVADFSTRTVRELDLGSPDIRYWHFLPGGKRIVVYQAGAWACDLVSEVCEEIHPKTVEPGGFTVVPGTDRRFVLGVESGPTRGFSFVDLPN